MLVEQIDHKILPSKLCSAKSSANFCPSSVLSYYLFVLFSGPSRSQVVSGFCWLRRDPLGCVAWNVALELMTAPQFAANRESLVQRPLWAPLQKEVKTQFHNTVLHFLYCPDFIYTKSVLSI